MSSGHYIFFGRDPKCGHVVCAVVDNPEHKASTAKEVARMIRDGYEVSRRKDQQGIEWCTEECPRMMEVRAEQARKEQRKRKKPGAETLPMFAER